jgi:Zn-dependent peptidase ImmA (M78 family)
MNCYKANAISRNDIRRFIRSLKRHVGLENEFYFPIVPFLENVLFVLIPDFQLEIIPFEEMGNKHGETYPSKNLIRIREDVYLRAIDGEGRDRLTIAHEIGHLFMHEDDSIALCRLSPNEKLKPYEDPEWQADAFGGELLASSYLIKGMDAYAVSQKCGVTIKAAKVQLKSLR